MTNIARIVSTINEITQDGSIYAASFQAQSLDRPTRNRGHANPIFVNFNLLRRTPDCLA